MTDWHHAYCMDCKCSSPTLFVEFNGSVSLYPIDDEIKAKAGKWLEEHTAPGHDVRLVHENDGNQLGPPKFPYQSG